jgi:SAM-dependent methyltransferase
MRTCSKSNNLRYVQLLDHHLSILLDVQTVTDLLDMQTVNRRCRRADRSLRVSGESLPYVIHSNEECQRLESQARLANIEGHLRHLPISSHSRVLDVGCGSGSMSRLIARSFPQAEVVGVDVREQYLDFARARALEEGILNLTFQSGDVFALPFPDACFDLVWSKYLLQWLREPRSALAEMKRVTKPGGFVVSCDYVGFGIEHHPIAPNFEREIRDLMGALVDVNIGRKVAPIMVSLGFRDVGVEMQTDTLFTVVGSIDPQRRQIGRRNFAPPARTSPASSARKQKRTPSSIAFSRTTTIQRLVATLHSILPAAAWRNGGIWPASRKGRTGPA